MAFEIWPAIVLYRRGSRAQRANFAFHHFLESECRNLSPQRGGESDHDVVLQRPAADTTDLTEHDRKDRGVWSEEQRLDCADVFVERVDPAQSMIAIAPGRTKSVPAILDVEGRCAEAFADKRNLGSRNDGEYGRRINEATV
jgi:hypothetical protein